MFVDKSTYTWKYLSLESQNYFLQYFNIKYHGIIVIHFIGFKKVCLGLLDLSISQRNLFLAAFLTNSLNMGNVNYKPFRIHKMVKVNPRRKSQTNLLFLFCREEARTIMNSSFIHTSCWWRYVGVVLSVYGKL